MEEKQKEKKKKSVFRYRQGTIENYKNSSHGFPKNESKITNSRFEQVEN